MKDINYEAITNCQQKVFTFFKLTIPKNCNVTEASTIISEIFRDPEKERLWKQYVEKTGDRDGNSSTLKPYDINTISRVKLADEKPPTAAQKKKIMKYFSTEDASLMLDDPSFTKEGAADAIEDIELEREREKEDFNDQVFNVRYDLLGHESEFKTYLWRRYDMMKPKITTIKAAIKELNIERPGWDDTSFRGIETIEEYKKKKAIIAQKEDLFFLKCKKIDPSLAIPISKTDYKGCIGLFLFALVFYVIYKLIIS